MSGAASRLAVWWLIFLSSLGPFCYAFNMAIFAPQGPDPVKDVLEFLGDTAFIFLLITLCISPLRTFFGYSKLLRFRRMVGLYALFYALLHALIYFGVIVNFQDIYQELVERPYVLVGMCGLMILLVLGITSPKAMVKKLGKKWKPLHRWIYLAVVFVWIHMLWQSRADITEAVLYGVAAALLLLVRIKRAEIFLKNIRMGACDK